MTAQIVIKLNEKKFKRILDEMGVNSISRSYSELTGLCVWYCHACETEKVPELGNKTRLEFIAGKLGTTIDKARLIGLKKYNEFLGHINNNH
ncbi:MAG: hypothetical protein U9O94_06525 [Nanoarchaeota archaeon]|nr:hypothetical protein [Nanoarchaeota archaeon]